ncbi:MAG TPA: hypothetical protein VEL73_05655, partial [Mycobacteriales bacterium]|nr:hypothetical protein [Mycobacteriales bacterium]
MTFREVPDWFSWDNQGGGVAVGSLAGDGRQDLVVLMVDSPQGQNRALYRVGKALDAGGAVTGGWTPWVQIPDWFSWENQGAGIALADLGGTGSLDLVVAMVDSADGPNRALYRVGKALDAGGAVTGGWTPWVQIPDWFSWENQGAGIALADLGGTGSLDLVVAMVDSADGPNR